MEETILATASAEHGPAHERHRLNTKALPTAEVDRLADEIAELSAHLDAATHRLLSLIRRFDEGSGWYTQGALSCAQWLSWRIGLDLCAAREKVRVARALGSLPHLDDALRRGQVSYSKVRAITRVATPENEASLLEMARSATASQLERICRGYRRALNGILGTLPADEESRRWVRESSTASGMVRIEAQLTPEEAAVVMKALATATERAWRPDRPSAESSLSADDQAAPGAPTSGPRALSPGLRRADALVAVAETYLAGAGDEGTPPIEVVVHVEASSLASSASAEGATLDDGTALPRATAERLACDAAVVTVVEDASGTPLDVGRRRRTIPSAMRRALRLRDRGCRFPGCPNTRVDGHHVVPWSRGGETKLANLCSLCRRHHRFVHELGYRIERRDGEGFAFFAAAGWEVKPNCAPPRLAADPVATLREEHRTAGLAIDATTGFPRWDGTPPDYHHIVHVLATKYAPPT